VDIGDPLLARRSPYTTSSLIFTLEKLFEIGKARGDKIVFLLPDSHATSTDIFVLVGASIKTLSKPLLVITRSFYIFSFGTSTSWDGFITFFTHSFFDLG
jgi:hypothetical protein